MRWPEVTVWVVIIMGLTVIIRSCMSSSEFTAVEILLRLFVAALISVQQ